MSTEPAQGKKSNRLIHEKSPYLLQHAYNPVDWYPWGEEALAKAKAEDKPVFVSIGYSTCHWCHVMEKECFDDEDVAKQMNEVFVSIKVDREERPDLDNAYMTVCQTMGRNCGWPLNVIMTPDKNPFFIASYIPKHDKYGTLGMMNLVPQIREIWRTRRGDLEKIGEDIKQRILAFETRLPREALGIDILDDAYAMLAARFDVEHGGFGSAPKFPSPHNLLFLLRYWRRTGKTEALSIVEKTLRSMRLGGIFDHVGLGFHRYSTDAKWLLPHFEKMLYDQALLTIAYLEAYQATGTRNFRITAAEVLEYVMRDLLSPEGGFYTAEDADSEGEEGKFYLWTEQEIRGSLSQEDSELATKLFSVETGGNFDELGSRRSGKNILYLAKPLEEFASELKISTDALIPRSERIQKKLLEARAKRIRPALDDKILTDWNGLMIAAFARASQVLDEEKYLQVAIRAAVFLLEKMKNEKGVLYHRYVKGERAIEGFLDDYAFLAFGLTEVYEASFNEMFLQAALELTDMMVSRFWGEREGGFFFTPKNLVDVVPKQKEIFDGAIPSGNSVALLNLLRLAYLSGNAEYEKLANNLSRTFSAEVKESPSAHTFMLIGVDFAVGPAFSVNLVGDANEQGTIELLRTFKANYVPNAVVSLKTPSSNAMGYVQVENKATAYVCRGQTCMPPTNKPETLQKLLRLP